MQCGCSKPADECLLSSRLLWTLRNVCLLPPPKKEVMFLVRSVCLSVCLSVGLLANLWTDFDEIFYRGRAWLKDQVIQFWWQSGSRFGSGSPKSEIWILWIAVFSGGLCSLSTSSLLLWGWWCGLLWNYFGHMLSTAYTIKCPVDSKHYIKNTWNTVKRYGQSILNLFIPSSFYVYINIVSCNCLSATTTSFQMSFHMVLPVERLTTQRASIAADLGMSRVGVCTQVGLVKEATPTDTTEVLVCASVQTPVLHVAGVREQCLSACLTWLVRCQFRLCAWWHMRGEHVHIRHVERFATDTRQLVSSDRH